MCALFAGSFKEETTTASFSAEPFQQYVCTVAPQPHGDRDGAADGTAPPIADLQLGTVNDRFTCKCQPSVVSFRADRTNVKLRVCNVAESYPIRIIIATPPGVAIAVG